MSKHTPGPWKSVNHSWSDTSILAPDFDHAICRLDINHATEESQEADEAQMAANARLIAAAPELLEALRIVRDTLPHINGNASSVNSLLKLTGAAIAKATGEQA